MSPVDFKDSTTGVGKGSNGWLAEFCTKPSRWVDHAVALDLHRVVILDIAAVGKQVGTVTGEVCCSIRQAYPKLTIWSGGGIRNASDANQLIRQGCDRCLIATALQGML